VSASTSFLSRAGGVALLALTPSCSSAVDGARPNILLIVADDLGYADLGCYGGEIRTPNLDRLASGGLRYTQFYNAGRCVPTRAATLTGLYPHRTGMGEGLTDHRRPGYRGDLAKRCATLAEVLKESGYGTYMVGKWMLTNRLDDPTTRSWPLRRGFDSFYGTGSGVVDYFQPVRLVTDDRFVTDELPADYYYTSALTEHAVHAIEEHRRTRGGEPFFLYLAHAAPHWPLHAPDEDVAACAGLYDSGWDAVRERRWNGAIEQGVVDPRWTPAARDERVPPWSREEHRAWQARRMEVYAAMVERMDRGVGRLLDALEATGALENTLIVFFSDNGASGENPEKIAAPGSAATRDGRPIRVGARPDVMPGPPDTYQAPGKAWAQVSNAPFRGYKGQAYEGAIATPLIVHWPAGIEATGAVVDQVSHVVDLMPTFLELGRARYPDRWEGEDLPPLDGVSLVPSFRGGAVDRGPIFFEHFDHKAVRTAGWKLVSGRRQPWELYDMESDRTETTDLAGERPELVEDLAVLWEEWARQCNVVPTPEDPPR